MKIQNSVVVELELEGMEEKEEKEDIKETGEDLGEVYGLEVEDVKEKPAMILWDTETIIVENSPLMFPTVWY